MHLHRNGKTPGITMPSAFGQESVIRQAYANARLGLGETDYVEASTSMEFKQVLSVSGY